MSVQVWFTIVGSLAIYLMMRSIIGARACNMLVLIALAILFVWRF